MRHLVAREPQRLLADQLGDLRPRPRGRCAAPAGSRAAPRAGARRARSRSSSMPSPVFALTGCSAWKSPRRAAAVICCAMCPAFSRSTLFERDHDRHAEREDALRDEAVAGADPLARREHEHDAVDVLERRVDRALHPLGERVERALEAGQVGEHELVVVAVRDAEDAAPRRLRLVGDDRDLAAAERVDERRLADVRPARDGDEARPHRADPRCPAGARRGRVLARSSRPRGGSRRARSATRAATGGSRRTATP